MKPWSTKVALARAYLGVRYQHQGRRAELGLDCVGLLRCWMEDLGVAVQGDRLDYPALGNADLLRRRLAAHFEQLPLCFALPGDVVLISMRPGAPPCHVAILTDHGLLHVTERRQVCEHSIDDEWRRRLESAWRLRE